MDDDFVKDRLNNVHRLYIVRLGFIVEQDAVVEHIRCHLLDIFGKHVISTVKIGNGLGGKVEVEAGATVSKPLAAAFEGSETMWQYIGAASSVIVGGLLNPDSRMTIWALIAIAIAMTVLILLLQ